MTTQVAQQLMTLFIQINRALMDKTLGSRMRPDGGIQFMTVPHDVPGGGGRCQVCAKEKDLRYGVCFECSDGVVVDDRTGMAHKTAGKKQSWKIR